MYRRLFLLCKTVVSHDVADLVPSRPQAASVHSRIPVKKVGTLVARRRRRRRLCASL